MPEHQNSSGAESGILDQASAEIRHHKLDAARRTLEKGLALDVESDAIVTSLKFVNFWIDRESRLASIQHAFERGEFYLHQWPSFEAFAKRVGHECEPCMFSMRKHVFGSALKHFIALGAEGDSPDSSLLLRIGRCHKGLGAYDEAVRFFEAAAAERNEDAEIIAELADAYALVNETRAAKAFFREAFFLEPQQVHLEMLESQLIRALVEKVEDHGYTGAAVPEWIPVYGALYGVFTVKRELRSIEYGKLKQGVYALEREIREGRDKDGLIEPRLINRYFWLIDHLIASGDPSAKVDEVLLKLRSLNSRIHKEYTS